MKSLLQKSLVYHLLQEVRAWWRFKYTLPKLREVILEGVRLDVSQLSPRMRNNLQEGRYEVQERNFASEFLTRDDAVLEIGGAIGFIGLFCQTCLGIERYATVEANPHTAEMLRRNYALNGVEPRLWNVALANEDGEIALNIGEEFWENSVVTNGAKATARQVTVPSLTFDSLLKKLPFAINTLIIDIEGAEQFIDFSRTPDSVKKIIIELHPSIIGHRAAYHVVAALSQIGFGVEREDGGTFYLQRP